MKEREREREITMRSKRIDEIKKKINKRGEEDVCKQYGGLLMCNGIPGV